jgi:hypothetical protein
MKTQSSVVMCMAVVAIAAFPAQSFASELDPVTPYRPTVSSPSAMSAEGQLEFELGGLRSKSDGQTRDSLPYLFKLALNKDWSVLLSGEVHVRAQDGSGTLHGLGDTTVTLKRTLPVDEQTAFGIEFGLKQPTAKAGLGSGQRDLVLNGILSKDFGLIHMDANLNATHIGGAALPESATQTGASASFSTPYNDQISLEAEFSAARRAGTSSTAQALVAVAYSPSKRATFDMGVAKGLTTASQNWALFAGVVIPIAKLW